MSGRIRTLNVILDKADNDDGGISGDALGNLVAKKPTTPIKNVFPTEDAEAIIIETTGDVIFCLYGSLPNR